MSCGDMFEFYFVHNLLHREMERCLKRHASYVGLSSVELQALWIVGSSDTTTLADIARVTNYTKEQLKEVVSALERDKLVEQVRSGDSLCTFVLATDEGKQIIRQISTRPSRCRCPANADDDRLQKLIEDCRSLVMDLKGRGACDLIANMNRLGE